MSSGGTSAASNPPPVTSCCVPLGELLALSVPSLFAHLKCILLGQRIKKSLLPCQQIFRLLYFSPLTEIFRDPTVLIFLIISLG